MEEMSLIRKELIKIDSDLSDRDACLSYLIDKADELHLLNDKKIYRQAVEARERTMPTSLGFLVAIPHGKSDAVIEPFVGILRTKKEFVWDHNSKHLVKLVLMIGVPQTDTGNHHLLFLSEVSKKIVDDAFKEQLFTVKSEQEMYELMNEVNKKVRERQ